MIELQREGLVRSRGSSSHLTVPDKDLGHVKEGEEGEAGDDEEGGWESGDEGRWTSEGEGAAKEEEKQAL